MCENKFTWKIFINMANDLFYKKTGRHLKDWEKEILKCFWNNMAYKQILIHIYSYEVYCSFKDEKPKYNKNYLIRYLCPNLMKQFSIILGEPVKKHSFKEAFKRRWERDNLANFNKKRKLIDKIISFLNNAVRNNITNVLGIENVDCSYDYMIHKSKCLSDIEIEVFRESWENKTYQNIADERKQYYIRRRQCYLRKGCSVDYLRTDVGSKLWKKVTAILGCGVNKNNFKAILVKRQRDLGIA